MTVTELIEMLQQLDNPDEKRIMVNDTAAGFRDIAGIEDALGYQYIIHTERPKRKRKR